MQEPPRWQYPPQPAQPALGAGGTGATVAFVAPFAAGGVALPFVVVAAGAVVVAAGSGAAAGSRALAPRRITRIAAHFILIAASLPCVFEPTSWASRSCAGGLFHTL
jgi:hypothetical protein